MCRPIPADAAVLNNLSQPKTPDNLWATFPLNRVSGRRCHRRRSLAFINEPSYKSTSLILKYTGGNLWMLRRGVTSPLKLMIKDDVRPEWKTIPHAVLPAPAPPISAQSLLPASPPLRSGGQGYTTPAKWIFFPLKVL